MSGLKFAFKFLFITIIILKVSENAYAQEPWAQQSPEQAHAQLCAMANNTVIQSEQGPGGVVLNNQTKLATARANYGQAGLKFKSGAVIPWHDDSPENLKNPEKQPDILVEKGAHDVAPRFFFAQSGHADYNDPDGANGGVYPIKLQDFAQTKTCPEETEDTKYLPWWQDLQVGNYYCVRTREGNHYAVIKVDSYCSDSVIFSWIYEPTGSRDFTPQAPVNQSLVYQPTTGVNAK